MNNDNGYERHLTEVMQHRPSAEGLSRISLLLVCLRSDSSSDLQVTSPTNYLASDLAPTGSEKRHHSHFQDHFPHPAERMSDQRKTSASGLRNKRYSAGPVHVVIPMQSVLLEPSVGRETTQMRTQLGTQNNNNNNTKTIPLLLRRRML